MCRSILPVGQLELLPGCEGVLQDVPVASNTGPRFMALDGAALQNLEVHHMPTHICSGCVPTKPTADLAVCYVCTLRLCVIRCCTYQVPVGCAMLCQHAHQLRPVASIDTNPETSDPKHNKQCLLPSLHATHAIALCEAAKWLWE